MPAAESTTRQADHRPTTKETQPAWAPHVSTSRLKRSVPSSR
jgi:hypothetical protein